MWARPSGSRVRASHAVVQEGALRLGRRPALPRPCSFCRLAPGPGTQCVVAGGLLEGAETALLLPRGAHGLHSPRYGVAIWYPLRLMRWHVGGACRHLLSGVRHCGSLLRDASACPAIPRAHGPSVDARTRYHTRVCISAVTVAEVQCLPADMGSLWEVLCRCGRVDVGVLTRKNDVEKACTKDEVAPRGGRCFLCV